MPLVRGDVRERERERENEAGSSELGLRKGRSENETKTEMYNKVSRRVRREVELCCVVWWRVSSEVFVGTVARRDG